VIAAAGYTAYICRMKAKLARWGNSLALRLPADVVRDFGLREGQSVELTPKNPTIEISTERRHVNGIPVYTIEELVADMKPENEPDLLDWGPDRGSEIIDDDYARGEIAPDDILSGRAAGRG
jgi:antitoxin MazE